jgi:ATPase subunit of ABC transporter with duplicated ATPase domains
MLAQLADDRLTVAQALGVADGLARRRRVESGEGSLEDATEADWTLQARLDAALVETGLPALAADRRLASLSGGERTRVALARLLIEAPDLLLLDEPTNNLDTEGRQAVAELLQRWRGGVVVASHDRALLERVDRIVELTAVGVTVFGGAWPAFAEARDAARARAEAELRRASDALRHAERAAQMEKEKRARRDKAGRARRAKGADSKMFLDAEKQRAENSVAREGHIAGRLIGDRMNAFDQARARVEVLTPLSIELPMTGLPGGRELIAFKDVAMAHGDRRLFGPLSFDVRGPERIAIAGANGSGKTTLLGLIAGRLEPTAGDISRPTDRVAMLDQHVGLLDPASPILDNLRRLNPDLSDNEARAALARFAFRNKAALQIAGTLSGGERLRAGLALHVRAARAAAAPAAGRADQPPRPDIHRRTGDRACGLRRRRDGRQPRSEVLAGDRRGTGDRALTVRPGVAIARVPEEPRFHQRHWSRHQCRRASFFAPPH